MLQVNNNRVELDEDLITSKLKFCRKFNIKDKEITYFELAKKSIDARDKNDIFYICSFYVDGDFKINHKFEKNVKKVNKEDIEMRLPYASLVSKHRPIVIGCGPAGLFATYSLEKQGLNPILFERGKNVDERTSLY